mmetsp:Transcript_32209/g.77889  ORF Transcript_32209/g.77889 Transcript_32209/m.77889 type:complete len:138 (-) Transcript_32209:168-581(-)
MKSMRHVRAGVPFKCQPVIVENSLSTCTLIKMAANKEGNAAMDRSVLDAQVRASVNQKLEESGEKERLKELLRKKLIERGWRDELKEYCKEVIKSKGLEQISVEDLVSEITPRGRATIPDDIKAELLERIRKFLSTN